MALNNIPTGCVFIDKFLGGGLDCGTVSLIYGEAETGKTTLAMQCAVNCALSGLKTLYVDCDGSFSTQRLAQISSNNLQKVLELIVLVKPKDFQDQSAVIDKIGELVSGSFGLIVLDTITSLYSLRVAEVSDAFELNRELNRQMATLAQIAKIQKKAVLGISQVRSVFGDSPAGVEPVAARVLKFWADTIISMKPTESPGVINAILEKTEKKGFHPLTFRMQISQAGISCHQPR